VVVATGTSDAAKALLGKVVGIRGGAMYAQYRCIAAQECLVLPEGTASVDAASCFVNPLTALGMVETMRMEGHTGLVHTAAANLGQMLQKICTADGIPLVNIVRKPEQAERKPLCPYCRWSHVPSCWSYLKPSIPKIAKRYNYYTITS
jgi:NADPH2:quinone reductase